MKGLRGKLAAIIFRMKKCSMNVRMLLIAMMFFGILIILRFRSESALLSTANDSSFSSELQTERFDLSKLSTGANYPVCNRLNNLFKTLADEEESLEDTEKHYADLYNKNQLYCGRQRIYGPLWIFGKKHNERIPLNQCVTNIVDGKRKMLLWLGDLCAIQSKHNYNYKKKKEQDLIQNANQYQIKEKKRGIIYTGLPDEHYKDIYQSIVAHRNLNVKLPIEVWANQEDMDVCKDIFESEGAFEFLNNDEAPMSIEDTHKKIGVTICQALPSGVHGFASKFHALLRTSLTDVLFMDADNIAVRDVNEIFDSKQYKETGAVLWPDLWGESCRESGDRSENGYSAFRTNVLWQSQVGGLKWQNTRDYAHESEAGQIAFDLSRHAGLLEIGRRFIEEKTLLGPSVNGDKDIFRLVHLMVGEPFYFVESFPGYSTQHPGAARDCLTHYYGTGGEEGNDNVISSNESGAFRAEPKLQDPRERLKEEDFWYKFGSKVGSIFEDSSTTNKKSKDIKNTNTTAKATDSSVVKDDSSSKLATKVKLNRLGLPAGSGWGAPIGTDPMFFHQLKQRDPVAFRFAHRAMDNSKVNPKQDSTSPSICFDFTNSYVPMRTEKHPSANRLQSFASRLFRQVDWKWHQDSRNYWPSKVKANRWKRAVAKRVSGALELFALAALLFAVVILILVRKSLAGPKSV
jgi:hypothetical protein